MLCDALSPLFHALSYHVWLLSCMSVWWKFNEFKSKCIKLFILINAVIRFIKHCKYDYGKEFGLCQLKEIMVERISLGCLHCFSLLLSM